MQDFAISGMDATASYQQFPGKFAWIVIAFCQALNQPCRFIFMPLGQVMINLFDQFL